MLCNPYVILIIRELHTHCNTCLMSDEGRPLKDSLNVDPCDLLQQQESLEKSIKYGTLTLHGFPNIFYYKFKGFSFYKNIFIFPLNLFI